MIQPLVVALLSLVSLAAAQNNTALEIEAIEAHFTQAGLVPDLLKTFDPSAVMSVAFDGVGAITPGQKLSQDQVKPTPNVSVTPANSSVTLGSTFTIVMVDADAVGTDESKGQTRHWLVNGVSLSGSGSNETVTTTAGTAITDYAGPAPPSGTGAHRYVILIYTQPSTFAAPADLAPGAGVAVFSLADYVSSSGLTGPVAGMYFTVEEGTATATPSATSAVVTSTLPAAQSSSSGSSGSKTGTGTGTGTAPASTNTNAAVASLVNTGAFVAGILAAAAGSVLL